MTDTNETGAEAGGESYFAKIEAEQNAAEAADAPEQDASQDAEAPAEGVESDPQAEAEPAKDAPQPEAEKEPLTPEEYRDRHRNVTAALRDERAEKRQLKAELEALRNEFVQFREAQPQQLQELSIQQRLQEYAGVDWQAWESQDPVAARNGADEFRRLQHQAQVMQQQAMQRQQEMQQRAEQERFQRFTQSVRAHEAEYRQAVPDYDKAVEFLKNDLLREAEGYGYFGQAAQDYVLQTIIETGQRVVEAGRDPAEFAYQMAQTRGYQRPVADIASVKAGAEAAKSISTLGTRSGGSADASFEETMSGLSGAAAKTFWEKAKKQRYA